MKTFSAGLQAVVSSSYDKTKTTILGRAHQKTINSQQVIGPALTNFIDTQTDASFIPVFSYFSPTTNRLFAMNVPASGVANIVLYNFDASTGAYSYVGKIAVNVPNLAATTHTLRGLTVNDTVSPFKIVFSTSGSVVINGGTFLVNGVTLSDFVPTGFPTIPLATSNGQKAVYFLQDSAAKGTAHIATTAGSVTYPWASTDGTINTKIYQQNGTAALPVFYSWDLASSPQISDQYTTVNSQTGGYGGTAPTAYFQLPGTTMPWAANDQLIIFGTAPAGFTGSTVPTQTVYFIRDIQLVSGNYYFNLSATSGGVAIAATSSVSNMTVQRGFGISTNLFSFKTGALPALTGTILQVNSSNYTKPVASPVPALNGQDCIFFATTTNGYMGKLTELTSGATTWPSLNTASAAGLGTDITAPTMVYASYSDTIDKMIFVTNTSIFVMKPFQNSGALTTVFGGITNTYLETNHPVTTQIGMVALSGIDIRNGWLFVTGSTVGQRGIVYADIYSDGMFDYSQVISPVLGPLPPGSVLKYMNTLEQLFDNTDSLNFFVRSATTSADAIFSSATGSWTPVATAIDNAPVQIGPYYQIKATFQITTLTANTPAQVNDFIPTILLPNEISDHWEGSVDNTSSGGASPAYSAFRLQSAYQTSVPTLYFRAYDDSGSLVASANTVTNPTLFEYSTNNGSSWLALGTIPNTVNTTEIRYKWASPPGTRVTVSIRES